MANPVSATRPFAAFEWLLASRYLRARRAERFVSIISAISLIGIALGVATLIIAMSLMNGFRVELMQKILGVNGHVVVQSFRGGLPNYAALVKRIGAIPGVTHVSASVDGGVLASRGKLNSGAVVRGLSAADLSAQKTIFDSLSPGARAHFGEPGSVIVGARLAEHLNLLPGQFITLMSPKGDVTPFGTLPRNIPYRVIGTFKIGASLYDDSYIFMPLDEAAAYFNLDNAVSALEVTLDNPDYSSGVKPDIEKIVGPYVRVLPWQENPNYVAFGESIKLQRNVMALILSLIILIAAMNLISGLIMLVKDKSPDIAILRTIGVTRGAVMRVFFIAGAAIGVTGTCIGLVAGILFSVNIENIRQGISALFGVQLFDPSIYYLTEMPHLIEPYEVLYVVLVALGLSFLATLLPSWRAARLDPVEGLRYE